MRLKVRYLVTTGLLRCLVARTKQAMCLTHSLRSDPDKEREGRQPAELETESEPALRHVGESIILSVWFKLFHRRAPDIVATHLHISRLSGVQGLCYKNRV